MEEINEINAWINECVAMPRTRSRADVHEDHFVRTYTRPVPSNFDLGMLGAFSRAVVSAEVHALGAWSWVAPQVGEPAALTIWVRYEC